MTYIYLWPLTSCCNWRSPALSLNRTASRQSQQPDLHQYPKTSWLEGRDGKSLFACPHPHLSHPRNSLSRDGHCRAGRKNIQNNYFSLDAHPIISCKIIRHKQEEKYLVKATKASLHDLQLCVCVYVCVCLCREVEEKHRQRHLDKTQTANAISKTLCMCVCKCVCV